MILKGNSRGGSKDLAVHLMKPENDHVEVHELRGFAARTLMGALNEAYAVSRATKCKSFLYSLSINPPATEKVSTSALVDAANRVERSLGLDGQPRAVVFHEKEGRRHAHIVWSRIRAEDMKAIRMSYDHTKLQNVSRDLFWEHGFKMPEGLADRTKRDPRNFDLADWQQAKRHAQDAKAVKAAVQDAWAISDSAISLQHALQERGFVLAKGDRRQFVVVDIFNEIRSLPRMAGVKTKDVRERLGDGDDLPSVDAARIQIADTMRGTLQRLQDQISENHRSKIRDFGFRKKALVERQRAERRLLARSHKERWQLESQARQARYRRGLKGIWDTLRGHNRRLRETNEREAEAALQKNLIECDRLISRHLNERRRLKVFANEGRHEFSKKRRQLKIDYEAYAHREQSVRNSNVMSHLIP